MGKSALITVMGMITIIAYLTLRMNSNTNENVSVTVDMFKETQARLISNTGVEIYLEKLYADTTLINTTSASQSLLNGSYIVKLEGVLPNVRVTSTSSFMGVQHISVADAYLEPISFPDVPAGMYISTNAVATAKEVGDMEIDGRNYSSDGTMLKNGDGKAGAVYGIGVDNGGDQSSILSGLQKPEKINGVIDTAGNLGYPSVGVTNLGIDWGKVYQYLANAADQTFINDIPSGTNLGNLYYPKITLVNADASSTKSIKINNGAGAGILVVNGNVKFAGNFSFQGIILCYKNSDLVFESSGTNQVVGGIIAAGKSVSFKLSGTMNVKYSWDAIQAVKSNLKANGYKVLSWYE